MWSSIHFSIARHAVRLSFFLFRGTCVVFFFHIMTGIVVIIYFFRWSVMQLFMSVVAWVQIKLNLLLAGLLAIAHVCEVFDGFVYHVHMWMSNRCSYMDYCFSKEIYPETSWKIINYNLPHWLVNDRCHLNDQHLLEERIYSVFKHFWLEATLNTFGWNPL